MMHQLGLLFVVAAPSGAGKTSLVRALLEARPEMQVSISHTTRPKRPAEVEGQHYHFVSDEAFLKMRDQGDFVEHAKVFGHWYGTSHQALTSLLDQGKHVLLDIDWQGAEQVKQRFSDRAVGVFLLPPSLTILRKRLEGRAQDHPEVIETRLANAQDEMGHYADFDYLIVNDVFDESVNALQAIVVAEELKVKRQEQALSSLLAELV